MRYAVLDGGKRVRALLVYGAGLLTQAPIKALDEAALAVEYVHAYSLVHDDLPCMDNDVLRRGKPTAHVKFGEAQAMLAGDSLRIGLRNADIMSPERGDLEKAHVMWVGPPRDGEDAQRLKRVAGVYRFKLNLYEQLGADYSSRIRE